MTWPRRYHEMCIRLQFKTKHAVQIVVSQDMTLHWSLHQQEILYFLSLKDNLFALQFKVIDSCKTYDSLKDILLRLNASKSLIEQLRATVFFVYFGYIYTNVGILPHSKILSFQKYWVQWLLQHSAHTKRSSWLRKISGFTRSRFREVILYTSATARRSGPTLNSIHAKSQTSANKS